MASHVGCVVALPVIRHVRSRVKTGPDSFETRLPIFPQTTDITRQSGYFRKVPCVDGSGLARTFFTPQAGRCCHVFGL